MTKPASAGTLMNKGMEKHRGAITRSLRLSKTPSTLWAGTDDGQIWLTRDGGAHWNDITPAA